MAVFIRRSRCDYQCNVSPKEQERGTQRCRRTDTKLVLIGKRDGIDAWQHRCSVHRQRKYLL